MGMEFKQIVKKKIEDTEELGSYDANGIYHESTSDINSSYEEAENFYEEETVESDYNEEYEAFQNVINSKNSEPDDLNDDENYEDDELSLDDYLNQLKKRMKNAPFQDMHKKKDNSEEKYLNEVSALYGEGDLSTTAENPLKTPSMLAKNKREKERLESQVSNIKVLTPEDIRNSRGENNKSVLVSRKGTQTLNDIDLTDMSDEEIEAIKDVRSEITEEAKKENISVADRNEIIKNIKPEPQNKSIPEDGALPTTMEEQEKMQNLIQAKLKSTPINVIKKEMRDNGLDEIKAKKKASDYMTIDVTKWIKILRPLIDVYSYRDRYLFKHFDQINYKYGTASEAEECVRNNIRMIMINDYFKTTSEKIEDYIEKICKYFIKGFRTNVIRVTDSFNDINLNIKKIPNYCQAFTNGVYNFKENKWEFLYNRIPLKQTMSTFIRYNTPIKTSLNEPHQLEKADEDIIIPDPFTFRDEDYDTIRKKEITIIDWYNNYRFEPIPGLDISSMEAEDLIEFFKKDDEARGGIQGDLTDGAKKNMNKRNICFELVWNMSHDINGKFDINMFKHICEIIGYTICPDLIQSFVILVGSGQNGKNSLWDGCFDKVVPSKRSNTIDAIETDKFAGGSMLNVFHNFSFENEGKEYTKIDNLKALTGSDEQMIERKGVDKETVKMNIKFLFSTNAKEDIKFQDKSKGMNRRVNLFEVWYSFDEQGNYMKTGDRDYYYTLFRQDLKELKDNDINARTFIYLGLYGIKRATCGMKGIKNSKFTKNEVPSNLPFNESFKFTLNDWSSEYQMENVNILGKALRNITPIKIRSWLQKRDKIGDSAINRYLYDDTGATLVSSKYLKDLGYQESKGIASVMNFLQNDEDFSEYFTNHDVYISLELIQQIIPEFDEFNDKLKLEKKKPLKFSSELARIYPKHKIKSISSKKYLLCGFMQNNLIIRETSLSDDELEDNE